MDSSRLYGLYQYTHGRFGLFLGAYSEGTLMEREGLMRNGRAPENSLGKSGKAKFLGGGGRIGFAYRPTGSHTLSLNLGAQSDAPLARNSFVAPRMQNNFVDNLKNELVMNGELSYQFRFGNFSGKLTGYYARLNYGTEQTAFYNDQESRFTYLTMTGVDREHYGLEAAFVYQVTSNFSLNLMGTISEAKYVNNPLAQVNYEGMNASTIQELNVWSNPVTGAAMPLRVIAKGMRQSGTPLAAVSLGANYNVNGWFFEANLNYYDRVYIDFSEYARLGNVLTNYVSLSQNELEFDVTKQELEERGGVLFNGQGNIVDTYSRKQEKADGGFMLDLSIGKYIRLKRGKSLSINLTMQNVTNNRDLKTGGYEQNRDDNYSTGEARPYRFSKNSKYYYANAINGFLNIGFKF